MMNNYKFRLKNLCRVLIFDLKIGAILALVGLIIFIIFNPIYSNQKKSYIYCIYSMQGGFPEHAMYVKHKSKINLLEKDTGKLFGKDIFFLNKSNKSLVVDTLGSNVIKFRSIFLARDSSEVNIGGYTLLRNLHNCD